ncbi:CLUMA_CG014160, isoform A [Clunio marinus]|uniref:CLUMA_CG014160, isoform A n=1 Tax=Clunio marinus TaxID=568069 RepID=A0A1J1ILB8_9DIPT|nr:CLUMA_CG014160, isoform A [Clunio marinus]
MDRSIELENRRICRICLSQDETINFSDIFESSNLPMEILSIGSVEVFQSDGMPRKICNICKTILGNAYKFKQICKRSDTLLKMYPITGNVPPRIEIPQEMIPFKKVEDEVKPEMKSICVGNDNEITTKSQETQTDPDIEQMDMIIEGDNYEIIAPPAQFSLTENLVEEEHIIIENEKPKLAIKKEKNHVKILNKGLPESTGVKRFKKPANVKTEKVQNIKPLILNAQLSKPKFEGSLVDSIETTPDGQIQIVSYTEEYLDDYEDVKSKEEPQDKSDDGVVYTCDVCERSFTLHQQLVIHKQNHERERNHPCSDCDKSFFTKYDLAKHVLTHTKQKDYECIVCSKSFSRSTLLYRHEKIHTDPNIPRYHCEACERVYLNVLDYNKHVLTHTKNRPFKCELCNKSFAFKQGLDRHSVSHDYEAQPHPCQYCVLRFPSAARLQRHLSSEHAGTRPFPCSKCTKRFMLSHHLYRHMRTSHALKDEAFCYYCPVCEKVYDDRVEFFDHCNEHALSLTCPLCKVTFESHEETSEHIKLHSKSDMYYCDYCNSSFMSSDDLNNHLIDQHSGELCSLDDDVEEMLEEKPRQESTQSSTKRKSSMVTLNAKEISVHDYEFLDDEQFEAAQIEEAAFVEYEEVTSYDPPPKLQKLSVNVKKSSAKANETPKANVGRSSSSKVKVKKEPDVIPDKKLPMKQKVLKMSQAKIEQLKKQGKIIMKDGNWMMRA